MKAHVERDWMSQGVKVWLYEKLPRGGARQLRVLPGAAEHEFQFMWEDIPEGTQALGPSLELPEEAVEALVAAASDLLPPSGAMAQHLDDARTVRDRLLSMLEKRGIR